MIPILKNITRHIVKLWLGSLCQQKFYYNKLLLKSNNNPKTTWNIVTTITNNKDTINNVSTMNIKGKISSNPLAIANACNTYFSSVAENLLIKNFSGKNIINNKDAISYLHQNFRQSFSMMKLRNTTPYEYLGGSSPLCVLTSIHV